MGLRVVVDETRAEKILSHLAAYRVSVREIMEAHLFDGKSVTRELWELSTKRGLVAVNRALGNRRSYYQLTGRGTSMLGLSEQWARPLGAQSLISNLSLAWFCCMGKHERRRIRRDALAERLGCNVPGGYHCVEKDGDGYRVYRVYVPMPGTQPREILRAAGDLVRRCRTTPGLEELIEERAFGVAILLETPKRASAIWERIRKYDVDGAPLASVAYFRVESVPDFVGPNRAEGRSHVQLLSKKSEADGLYGV
jgi:hypothetical protein